MQTVHEKARGPEQAAQMEEEERNGRPLMSWRVAVSNVLALIVT
jgi:hypothetical protein